VNSESPCTLLKAPGLDKVKTKLASVRVVRSCGMTVSATVASSITASVLMCICSIINVTSQEYPIINT